MSPLHGHGHGQSQKAIGWAFTLNLVRSLGLWEDDSVWPSDVAKPAYSALTPAGHVDWNETLRKYAKHNSTPSGQLNVAVCRLECAVWRAVAAQETASASMSLQSTKALEELTRERKRRKARYSNASNSTLQAIDDPNELVLKGKKRRAAVSGALEDLQSTAADGCADSAIADNHTAKALAYLALGNLSSCQHHLKFSRTKAKEPTHSLDLSILSLVLEGMCYEQQAREASSSSTDRTQCISNALERYRSVATSPPPSSPEAQRYTEMALRRLAALQEHSNDLQAYRQYFGLTSSWKFISPLKRERMYWTYFYSMLHKQLSQNSTMPDLHHIQHTFKLYESLIYSSPILSAFPRAGDPTYPVNDYMDLVYAYWARGLLLGSNGKSGGDWACDAIQRCQTATYASQRLLRYLTIIFACLSFAASDRPQSRSYAEEALKNLRLYVSLYLKSKETDQLAVQHELRTFRERTEATVEEDEVVEPTMTNFAAVSDTDAGLSESDAGSAQFGSEDLETVADFCSVCCVGTRLLLRESTLDGKQEAEDARINLVEEALATMKKAADRIQLTHDVERNMTSTSLSSSGIRAEVALWHGVAKAEFALVDAEPETARDKAKESLQSLLTAETHIAKSSDHSTTRSQLEHPVSTVAYSASLKTRVLYSLAYAQLEMRDVAAALATAKKAIESLSRPSVGEDASQAQTLMNWRVWHLFVLALSAKKDWVRAAEAAELALDAQPAGVSSPLTQTMRGTDPNGRDRPTESKNSIVAGLSPVTPVQIPQLPDDDAFTAVKGNRMSMATRADAPFDPASTGAIVKPNSENDTSERAQPNVEGVPPQGTAVYTNGVLTGSSTSLDAGSGDSDSDQRAARRSPANPQRSSDGSYILVQSCWDELEYETELWITRNRCIEATDGPEIALHDLQTNVFPRFSKRKELIEQVEEQSARGGSQPPPTINFPNTSAEMQNRNHITQKLNEHNDVQKTRPRSILGSITRRKRTRTGESAADRTTNGLDVPSTEGRPGSVRSFASGHSIARTRSPTLPPTSGRTSFETAAATPKDEIVTPNRKRSHPRAEALLAKLWLVSAASFRRWGKMEECKGAINEAEDAAGDVDPNVWVQFALYLYSLAGTNPKERNAANDDLALLALMKASAISTDHVPTVLTIAKLHYDIGNPAIAEGFLDVATQSNAWDSPEAWYLLAKVYEETRREKRARESLIYALGLEETRPIRELRYTLPRYL